MQFHVIDITGICLNTPKGSHGSYQSQAVLEQMNQFVLILQRSRDANA